MKRINLNLPNKNWKKLFRCCQISWILDTYFNFS